MDLCGTSQPGFKNSFGIKVGLEAFFRDYWEVVELMFPFLIETEYGLRYRTMEIENILVNTDINPSDFVMPQSEGK
jgi:hypothetical protein